MPNYKTVRLKSSMVKIIEKVATQYDQTFLDALYRIIQEYQDNRICPNNAPVYSSTMHHAIAPLSTPVVESSSTNELEGETETVRKIDFSQFD